MSEVKTLQIDIAEHFHSGKGMPVHDPGTIVVYVFKMNEQTERRRDPIVTYDNLLDIAGVRGAEYEVFQIIKQHGELIEDQLFPHQQVDLSGFGIERFITKRKVAIYTFKIGVKTYTTTEQFLTVRQLLEDYAQVDANAKTLARRTPTGFHEYTDLNEQISMEGCPEFTLFDNDATGVS